MSTGETHVIVGGGLAGGKAAEALRAEGFGGDIVLVSDENELPYERPPLSKDYLTGKAERDSIYVNPRGWYDDNNVVLRLGVAATKLDVETHTLTLADGESIGFGKLLLATGSSPRRIPVPGGDLSGVHYLRRVGDSDALKAAFSGASRVAVIGAGWIGLETAAAARGAGADVTVLEMADLPLVRVLGPEVAAVFDKLHRDNGVDMRYGVSVNAITGDGGKANGVALADGTRIEADVVVVGVGITPNVDLASAAGLAVDNGVLVDAHLRTSHPDVFAAGDVANAEHPTLKRRIRVEHWANALNQPAVAVKSMLGQDAVYDKLPYFYTDQYDLGMEYTGYVEPGGYDSVVFRGDKEAREFIVFWVVGGPDNAKVLAGMNVNVWDVTDPIKALIRSGTTVDLAKLADTSVPLESLAK